MPAVEEKPQALERTKVLELDELRGEWKEARASIDRFDKITVDLRKFGFSLISLILFGGSVLFQPISLDNPIPLVIVPLVIVALTIGLFFADSYYQVLLLSSILYSRQLENYHQEIFDLNVKSKIYLGYNLTNFIEDKVQKTRSYTFGIIVYILFLSTGFILGFFSLDAYHQKANVPFLNRYTLILLVALVLVIIVMYVASRGASGLIRELRSSEVFENTFVIKKIFDETKVTAATKKLAKQIFDEYHGKDLKILTLGMGGLLFSNTLISQLKKLGRTNVGLVTGFTDRVKGEIILDLPEENEIAGQNILIVDDLASSGKTMLKVIEKCKSLNAAQIRTCVLLDAHRKRTASTKKLRINFVGLQSDEEKHFFVGSGLDGGERMGEDTRNKMRLLPYIGIIISPLDGNKDKPEEEDGKN